MCKQLLLAGAVAMTLIVPATPALAAGSIVIDGDTCYGFVPTPSGQLDPTQPLLTTTDSHQVQNGGWASLTCHFDIPDAQLPAKGVKADGVQCMIPGFGLATTSRMSASPGGRAVGTCRKKLR
jgi:hypothetical protein